MSKHNIFEFKDRDIITGALTKLRATFKSSITTWSMHVIYFRIFNKFCRGVTLNNLLRF